MKKKWYVNCIYKDAVYASLYNSYSVRAESEFDNYDDAVDAAKKEAKRTKEDVIIYTIDSVISFPEPDLTVNKVDA